MRVAGKSAGQAMESGGPASAKLLTTPIHARFTGTVRLDDKTSSTMPRFRHRPSGLMNGLQTQQETSIGQTEIKV